MISNKLLKWCCIFLLQIPFSLATNGLSPPFFFCTSFRTLLLLPTRTAHLLRLPLGATCPSSSTTDTTYETTCLKFLIQKSRDNALNEEISKIFKAIWYLDVPSSKFLGNMMSRLEDIASKWNIFALQCRRLPTGGNSVFLCVITLFTPPNSTPMFYSTSFVPILYVKK